MITRIELDNTNGIVNFISSITLVNITSLVSENRFSDGAVRISDYFNRPIIIEQNDNMDELTRGMSYQSQKASDQYFDPEVSYDEQRV